MGLKKKSKISAEFSMSSLTDIIFLLLIFFMLTSSVMVPNALNLKMPGKSSAVTLDSKPSSVTIRGKNTFYVNGKKVSKGKVETMLTTMARNSRGKKLDMTLSPSPEATQESVVYVMDIMYRKNINCILAIED